MLEEFAPALDLFQDRSIALATCTFLLIGPVYTSVGLRFYVRIYKRTWGPDDHYLLLATLLFIPCAVFMLNGGLAGLGVRDTLISADGLNPHDAAKWYTCFTLVHSILILPLRLTASFTLLRITEERPGFQRTLLLSIAIYVLICLIQFLYLLLRRLPFHANWTGPTPAATLASTTTVAITAVAAVASLLIDLVHATLPLALLLRTSMRARHKASVYLLLAMPSIATGIPATIRLPLLLPLTSPHNFFDHATDVTLTRATEAGLGCVLAGLCALHPLLERLGWIEVRKPRSGRGLQTWTGPRDGVAVAAEPGVAGMEESADGGEEEGSVEGSVETVEGISLQDWCETAGSKDAGSSKRVLIGGESFVEV